VLRGKQAQRQERRPRGKTLLAEIGRDQFGIEVAHPLKTDDQHRFRPAQIPAALTAWGQERGSGCADRRRQQQVIAVGAAFVGYAQFAGQGREGFQGAGHALASEQAIGMSCRQRRDGVQRPLHQLRRGALGRWCIPKHIHGARGPVGGA